MSDIDPKSPNEDYDIRLDWTSRLSSGEKVVSAVWTLDSGITQHDDSIAADGKSTSVFISGGTAGMKYRVVCRTTTDNSPPRVFESAFNLQVMDK